MLIIVSLLVIAFIAVVFVVVSAEATLAEAVCSNNRNSIGQFWEISVFAPELVH